MIFDFTHLSWLKLADIISITSLNQPILFLSLIPLCIYLSDLCREADGELFDSSAFFCGLVLLWVHEWWPLCLIQVNIFPLCWPTRYTWHMYFR